MIKEFLKIDTFQEITDFIFSIIEKPFISFDYLNSISPCLILISLKSTENFIKILHILIPRLFQELNSNINDGSFFCLFNFVISVVYEMNPEETLNLLKSIDNNNNNFFEDLCIAMCSSYEKILHGYLSFYDHRIIILCLLNFAMFNHKIFQRVFKYFINSISSENSSFLNYLPFQSLSSYFNIYEYDIYLQKSKSTTFIEEVRIIIKFFNQVYPQDNILYYFESIVQKMASNSQNIE